MAKDEPSTSVEDKPVTTVNKPATSVYTLPEFGLSVEAASIEEAVAKAKKLTEKK